MSMLHEISAASPRYKKPNRKGRGEGSGHGKTSGRGTKGAKARTGKYVKRGHEHGQTPIYRRLPKRGFSNHDFERRFHVVNLSELERFADGSIVDATVLIEAGLVPDDRLPIKILGDGAIGKKLTVVAGWFSKSAHKKIGEAGGTAQGVKGETFEFPKPKKKFIPREPVKKSKVAAEPAPASDAAPAAAAAPQKPSSEPPAAEPTAAPE